MTICKIEVVPCDTLQQAIDSTPDGGVLSLPAGIIDFDHVTITKSITIRGAGCWSIYTSPYGAADYSAIIPPPGSNLPPPIGTVLHCTATSGIAIDASNTTNIKVNLENLMLLGSGDASATATGIAYGSAVHYVSRVSWINVLIANFAVGMKLAQVYQSTFLNMDWRGCQLAVDAWTINASVFLNCSGSGCSQVYFIDNTSRLSIRGGALQGTSDTAIHLSYADECDISGVYFENANANYAIHWVRGDSCAIYDNHMGTPGDKVWLEAQFGHGRLRVGKYDPSWIIDGQYNEISGDVGSHIIHAGSVNVETRINGYGEIKVYSGMAHGLIIAGGSLVQQSPDGSWWKINVGNDGALQTNKVTVNI